MTIYKLSELGSFKNGANYPKGSYGDGIKIINVKDLFTLRYVNLNNLAEIKNGILKNEDDYTIMENDILFSRSSLVQSGAGMCAIVPKIKEKMLFCGFIIRFRLKRTDVVNPLFLLYILRSPAYRKLFTGTQQTNIANINQDSLGNVEVNLPSIEEQNRIASIISNIDTKIELNKSISSELESMAKTLYDYWFLQFEFPNEEGNPYKSSGGKMVWNEELKRDIPEGWSTTTIGDITICHDSERIPLSGKDRKNMVGDIPYYGATDVMGYVDKPIFNGDYVLLAEDGSVMDEKGHPILQRVTGQVWVNNHAHVLEPIKNHSCKLLMMLLKDVYVPMIKTGSIQMKINQENMNGITVPSIPEYLKEKINLELCTIEKKQLQIIAENHKLASLRDFLLPLLMNGQVGFKE